MKSIDYRERIRRLAESLSVAGVDAYVGTRPASLHYLVGAFMPWRGAVIVTSSGEAEAIYFAMDSERVRKEGWGLNLIDWGLDGSSFIEKVVSSLKEKGLEKGRIGLDLFIPGLIQDPPGSLLAHEFLELRQLLPKTDLINGTPYIDKIMVIKSPEEVERLRLASRVAEIGFKAGLSAIKPGITENMIAGVIENTIRNEGSNMPWGIGGGTEVGSGYRTAFYRGVTYQPTDKKIGENEFLILDVHTMIELYLGDVGFPVFLGRTNPEQQKLIDCWEETVDFLLSALKPNCVAAEISTQATKIFAKYRLEDYGLPRFGHGIGTCARLEPTMGPKSQDVLKPGTVLVLGAQLFKPGIGGLRLEYPVLITETGNEPLCMTPAKVYRVSL